MCTYMKNEHGKVFCLNPQYSTTRIVTKEQPRIENHPSSEVQSKLFLPSPPHRQGEGGLRTKGYFKRSFSEKPLVSVITVVFNGGAENLEQTIRSVVAQTYDNVEYIIIDGGSTNGTVDIIRQYEEAIDYWISEPDEGIYDAMNKGIMLSTGQFLYFLGADDCLFDVLDKISSNLTEDFKICYGNVLKRTNNVIYDRTFTLYKLFKRNICHQAIFYTRNVLILKGNFNIRYNTAADYELNLKCWADKNIVFQYCPLLIADSGDGGVSSQIKDKIFQKDKAIIIKNNFGTKYYLLFITRRFIVKCFVKLKIKNILKKILYFDL